MSVTKVVNMAIELAEEVLREDAERFILARSFDLPTGLVNAGAQFIADTHEQQEKLFFCDSIADEAWNSFREQCHYFNEDA